MEVQLDVGRSSIFWIGAVLSLGRQIDPRSLPPLLKPFVADQVVIESDKGLVFEQQCVVEARDWPFAPPLVVDSPALLNLNHAARPRPADLANRARAAISVGIDTDWCRSI